MTRRVAAVDCGTNSLRLLLADIDPGRAGLTDVVRRMERTSRNAQPTLASFSNAV